MIGGEEVAAILANGGVDVGSLPGVNKAPEFGAIEGFDLAEAIDELIAIGGGIFDVGLVKKLAVVICAEQMDIEGDGAVMAVVEDGLPDVGVEIFGGDAAGTDEVIDASDEAGASETGEGVGVADEYFRCASAEAGDEEFVVIGSPFDSLHGDVDVGMIVVELFDDAKHGLAVGAGEAGPEAQFDGAG